MCLFLFFASALYIYSMMSCRILPFGAVHAVATVEELATKGCDVSLGPVLMFGGSGFL